MAIIYTYPQTSNFKSNDCFIISDGSDNKTKKLSASGLLSWIDNNLEYDLQQVLNAGSEADETTGTWNTVEIFRNQGASEKFLQLAPSAGVSGEMKIFSKVIVDKGLDSAGVITSPQSEKLVIIGDGELTLSSSGTVDIAAADYDAQIVTGDHTTTVDSGELKVTTIENKQTYTSHGDGTTAFEFKTVSGVTTNPYFILQDDINLLIKSKVTDSLGVVGTDGKILKSDPNGFVKWADDEANAPGGVVSSIQFKNASDEFDGDQFFKYEKNGPTTSRVTLGTAQNHAGHLFLHSDGDNSVQAQINMVDTGGQSLTIKPPLVYSTDYELTLPVDEPQSTTNYLVSNASGEMSWSTAGGGAAGVSGTVQISDGNGNFTAATYLNYSDQNNVLFVGTNNSQNVPAASVVIGAAPGKSGTLSILGPTGSKVQFQAATTGTASIDLVFPDTVPAANQILESDATGQLSWINTPTGSASGTLGLIQFADNNNGFDSDATLKYDSNKHLFVGLATNLNADSHTITIGASENKNGKLEIFSQDNHKLTLSPATTTTANLQLKFPADTPSANQILESDGSGNLSWINTPTGGGGAPAGAQGEIQYNDGSGNFAASATFKRDTGTGAVTIGSQTGQIATLSAAGNNNLITQGWSSNLGIANFDNAQVSASFSTVVAIRSANTTQANTELITFFTPSSTQPSGSIVYDTATSQLLIPTTSDERLKENKADYEKSDAKTKIRALNVKSFTRSSRHY